MTAAAVVKILENEDRAVTFQWTLTDADPDGTPIGERFAAYSDRSFHVFGTFGGGTVAVQGSNESGAVTNWAGLSSAQGTPATFTAAGLKEILEASQQSRPLLTGATGATLTVIAMLRKPNRGMF